MPSKDCCFPVTHQFTDAGPASKRHIAGGQAEPVMTALHRAGAHGDAVWQLQWLDRGTNSEEALVSNSADGRFSQWSTSQVLSRTLTLSKQQAPHPP